MLRLARGRLLPASLAKISPHSHVPVRGVLLVDACLHPGIDEDINT